EATLQTPHHVVLTPAFPHAEKASGANPAIAGIQADHHFTQCSGVPATFTLGLDVERTHATPPPASPLWSFASTSARTCPQTLHPAGVRGPPDTPRRRWVPELLCVPRRRWMPGLLCTPRRR